MPHSPFHTVPHPFETPRERPGFLVWCAGAEDPKAEEERLAAGDPGVSSVWI